MLIAGQCTPHFLFGLAEKKTGRARSKRKGRLGALRCSGPPRARGSAYRCKRRFGLAFGHAILFYEIDTAVPWRMVPTSSGWLSHGAASLFATAHAPAKNPAARSAAERAEREADQMRPCTPLTFAPAPRESAFKPVPHPAAPVGRSSQTRRHHLSSTPVQHLCTDVQRCDQQRFFSYTGRGAFSFWR